MSLRHAPADLMGCSARRVRIGSGTLALLASLLPLPGVAQTTCYTNPEGGTLCSTPEGVVTGTTNAVGDSTYRDDRGNLLQYEADPFGKASLQLRSGKAIDWYPSAPAERGSPRIDTNPPWADDSPRPGVPAAIYPLPQ